MPKFIYDSKNKLIEHINIDIPNDLHDSSSSKRTNSICSVRNRISDSSRTSTTNNTNNDDTSNNNKQ